MVNSTSSRILIEVCITSVADAIVAQDSGADRLELNLALELGGLTPTVALLHQVKQEVSLPIVAMVRPRGAGFHYSPAEQQLMLAEAETLLAAGADGVACGALRRDNSLDAEFWGQLLEVAAQREVVFHRAFDVLSDPIGSLQQLIQFGTTRILTSGGKSTAAEGTAAIAELVRIARGQIEILPGAGISASNVAQLVQATGCQQVHGSFSRLQSDPAGPVADVSYRVTCPLKVRAVREVLDQETA